MIGEIIYTILQNDTDVTDKVGQRIFPQHIEQGEALPAIAYTSRRVQVNSKDGWSGLDRWDVELNIVSDDYDAMEDLDNAINDALKDYDNTLTIEDEEGASKSVRVVTGGSDDSQDIYFEEPAVYGRQTTYQLMTKQTP